MAFELIEIKDFPKTTTLTGAGDEIFPVSKADGKTYGIKSSDFKAFLGTVQTIAPRPIKPTDPAPSTDGIYTPTENGTYPDGIVVDLSEGYNQLLLNGGIWSKVVSPINLAGYLQDQDIGGTGNLFSTGVIVNDRFIGTDGIIRSGAQALGWQMIRIPVNPLTGYALGGINLTDVFNVAFYSSLTTYISGSVLPNNPSGSIVLATSPAGSAYIFANIKRPVDTPSVYENAGLFIGNKFHVGADTILGLEISAKFLSDDNEVPYATEPNNAVSKKFVEDNFAPKGTVMGVSVQSIRKATFSIVFDDGLASDNLVADTLDTYGFKCGFALKTGSYVKSRYVALQDRGFEILSHSINHERFDDTSTYTLEQAEVEIKGSLDNLLANGFNVKGWVTPYSQMKPEFVDIVKKYYEYGYTQYFGTVDPLNENDCFHTFWNDTRLLKRVSMESSTEANLLSAIDAVVANRGHCIMYAHAYPDTLTTIKFEAILGRLKELSDGGIAEVLTPIDGINRFFNVRHSDLVELKNLTG